MDLLPAPSSSNHDPTPSHDRSNGTHPHQPLAQSPRCHTMVDVMFPHDAHQQAHFAISASPSPAACSAPPQPTLPSQTPTTASYGFYPNHVPPNHVVPPPPPNHPFPQERASIVPGPMPPSSSTSRPNSLSSSSGPPPNVSLRACSARNGSDVPPQVGSNKYRSKFLETRERDRHLIRSRFASQKHHMLRDAADNASDQSSSSMQFKTVRPEEGFFLPRDFPSFPLP